MKLLIPVLAVLVAACGKAIHDPRDVEPVEVVLETNSGIILIEVYADRAPVSARAFLKFVDDGSFERHGSFYRTVRKNQNDRGSPQIDVLQGGWPDAPASLAGIEHERTLATGLRHTDGTVSLARRELGTATGAQFFICIGDQPALDSGGGRDPFGDGGGFAAFGRVTQGIQVVRKIHQGPTSSFAADPYKRGQSLDPPVRFLRAFRKYAAS